MHASNKRVPSSPEVEELSSGSGDDPGDRRLNRESGILPYSLPPVLLPARLSSYCCVPLSGDSTDWDSLGSAHVPRRPSRASSPGNRLLKSVGIAGRFLGVRLHLRFFTPPDNCFSKYMCVCLFAWKNIIGKGSNASRKPNKA